MIHLHLGYKRVCSGVDDPKDERIDRFTGDEFNLPSLGIEEVCPVCASGLIDKRKEMVAAYKNRHMDVADHSSHGGGRFGGITEATPQRVRGYK